MTKKKEPSQYKGVLREPLPPHTAPVGLLGLSNSLPDGMSERDFRKAVIERIAALFKHYGLHVDIPTKSDWQKLALHLAMDHVPAFQFAEPESRGRPHNETSDEEWLVEFIDSIRSAKEFRSDKRACENLYAHPPSNVPLSLSSLTVEGIRNRLSKARKRRRYLQKVQQEWAGILAKLSQ